MVKEKGILFFSVMGKCKIMVRTTRQKQNTNAHDGLSANV